MPIRKQEINFLRYDWRETYYAKKPVVKESGNPW